MKFNHCAPKELIELTTESINGRRYYVTPKGKYPSITTVLSAFPKPELLKWRQRVGEEQANKITKEATTNGTRIHAICEDFLNNKPLDLPLLEKESFLKLKPHLLNINNIHGLEVPLYSDQLRIAGRTDCIAEYDGVLSVIDFKTSRKVKKEEWILDYFLQATMYSIAYYELTGIKIKQIVILIAVTEDESQIFVKNTNDYVMPLLEKVKIWRKIYENI